MTRSGKTQDVLQRTANDARLIVYDFPGRDWPATCERIEGLEALCKRLDEVRAAPVRISYRGELNSKHFGTWASLVLAWAQWAPLTAIAEELADVVHAGKAPQGWRQLVSGGLAYEITLHGITQRIQETDKSIFGNATTLRVFRTGNLSDSQYLARKTGIPVDDIESLNKLQFLEKVRETGTVQRGTVTF